MPPIDRPHQLNFLTPSCVGDRQHVAAEPLHRVGALRHAGLAVAAAVVAHHAEMLRPVRRLLVPHVQVGAERIAEDQGRCVGWTFDLVIQLAAVISLDHGHRFLARVVFFAGTPIARVWPLRRAAEPCDRGRSGRLVLLLGGIGLLVFVFGRAREHLEQRARLVLRLFDRRCVGDHSGSGLLRNHRLGRHNLCGMGSGVGAGSCTDATTGAGSALPARRPEASQVWSGPKWSGRSARTPRLLLGPTTRRVFRLRRSARALQQTLPWQGAMA